MNELTESLKNNYIDDMSDLCKRVNVAKINYNEYKELKENIELKSIKDTDERYIRYIKYIPEWDDYEYILYNINMYLQLNDNNKKLQLMKIIDEEILKVVDQEISTNC